MNEPTDQEIRQVFLSCTSDEIIRWCQDRDLGIKSTYNKAWKLGILQEREAKRRAASERRDQD